MIFDLNIKMERFSIKIAPKHIIFDYSWDKKETNKLFRLVCLFWRRRRDSTGFQPVVFALRTVYFMSLFAPQKDGRRVRVSLPFLHYTEKRYRGKSRYLSCEGKTIEIFLRFRCLDLNSCKLFHSMLLALKASTIGLIFIFPIFNEEA